MNTVSAQLWKGQLTAGAGVRVNFISSCPSALQQGRSLSAAAEGPGGSTPPAADQAAGLRQ